MTEVGAHLSQSSRRAISVLVLGAILLITLFLYSPWHRHQASFSVSAAVGFVSLFGVAVMSGVLFVAELHRQRLDGGRPLKQTVLAGASGQLRALLMLIVAAMLGMVPAAFATGIGSDIQRPLATVVLGGLASTLLFTLLVSPCLHYLAQRARAGRF